MNQSQYVINQMKCIDQLKHDIDKIISNYKLISKELYEIKNSIEVYDIDINEKNKDKTDKFIDSIKSQLDNINQEEQKNQKIISDLISNNVEISKTNSTQEQVVYNNPIILEEDQKESEENNQFPPSNESQNPSKVKTTEDSTKSKNDINSSYDKQRDKFKENCLQFYKMYRFKIKFICSLFDISEYPVLDNDKDDEQLKKFLENICKLETENKINKIEINDRREEDTVIKDLEKDIPDIDDPDELFEGDENFEIFESYDLSKMNFDEIKNKLFYFINIISKENYIYGQDELEVIYKKLSECLNIQENNLFLLNNSHIDNFVKCYNFNEIPLTQFQSNLMLNKFSELNSIKMKLLINRYEINKDCFDNRGNFLSPNSRKIIFRGKEVYEPPYGWMGLGLNVLGKYENDIWLKDITDKSEWAIAYRGIFSKDANKIKNFIKYYIEKQDLKNAVIEIKEQKKNKRNSKTINKGVYMTPHIKVAEKYTQSISFNSKKYKVLLMAKVLTKEIVEPEDSDFWILEDKDIRIYRILFKEIK